jgi:uncharacterized protein (TIGR02679 family)
VTAGPQTAAGCPLCGGACAEADLAPLVSEQLRWLWEQVATAADRRGNPHMSQGRLQLRAPQAPEERAAAVGLVGGKPLAPGQQRPVDLAQLTGLVRRRGARLTPGAVAAHACARPLATKAAERVGRAALENALYVTFADAWERLPLRHGSDDRIDVEDAWARLRRSRWVGRLCGKSAPHDILRQVLTVLAALPTPGSRVDRRHLADALLDDPHGLDEDKAVTGHILGLLTGVGLAPTGRGARAVWNAVGVDLDDLTGGLLVTGIYPAGWHLPAGAVLTLPPRELSRVSWEAPDGANDVFVTENPSVLAAACEAAAQAGDAPASAPVRVVCTVGTPAAVEIAALAALARAGWRVWVRADFDDAGLRHVRALLDGVPGAVPWRMGAEDYRRSVSMSPAAPPLDLDRLGETSWDLDLAATMLEIGVCAYEETVTSELVRDVLTRRSSSN